MTYGALRVKFGLAQKFLSPSDFLRLALPQAGGYFGPGNEVLRYKIRKGAWHPDLSTPGRRLTRRAPPPQPPLIHAPFRPARQANPRSAALRACHARRHPLLGSPPP